MKAIITAAILIASASAASAQYTGQPSIGGGLYGTGSNPNSHYVQPYVRQDGTFVGGHYQTNPNNTQFDNYGTRGNYNPYTNQFGTRSPRY